MNEERYLQIPTGMKTSMNKSGTAWTAPGNCGRKKERNGRRWLQMLN